MKVLQILPQLESGGVETGTVDLAAELVRRGHQAVVISAGGRLVEKLIAAGAGHITLPVHKKSLIHMAWCAFRVAKIISAEHVDIVHARSRVPAWISFLATRWSRAFFITTCHGYYSNHFFSSVMGWADRVIVISNIIGAHMVNDFKVAKEKIRLVYRGVDLQRFVFRGPLPQHKKEQVVGIIGRITPLKGHVHFLKALPNVFNEFPRCRAVIIGDAPPQRRNYRQELVDMVARLNMKHRVQFCGTCDNIPASLRGLDVVVMATTTEEAFGRVIIEAGAVGIPVVATAVGGIVEIIEDGREGLLVEPADPNALSQAIIRMLRERETAQRCVDNLRKKVEKTFTLQSLVEKTITVYEEGLRSRRILVIKLGALGDVVLISAALRALRKKFPDAVIDVLVREEYKDILQKCPDINNLVLLKQRSKTGVIETLLRLRRENYRMSVDFQNNAFSHALAWAAGVPERFGYRNKKLGFLLNRGIADTRDRCDPVTHQFRILGRLGIESTDRRLDLWIRDQDRENARALLAEHWHAKEQVLIGINAFASSRWKTKAWTPQGYAAVADALAQKLNARIVFTGTAQDAGAIDAIIVRSRCKPINAAGKTTVMELAALIRCCRVFISVDSAALHIAAAVRTPCVALFGPTDPLRHMPPAEHCVVLNKKISCAPCYRRECSQPKCMTQITADEVVDAVFRIMPKKGNEPVYENITDNHAS
ncbi:MAG: glycosyltransferase family 9 protein [Candidatus Omnitrophica bacterium]|nr:glycosyltransferase family 9 protein [Candidatus Omnitrophota bacterium]